MLTMNNCKSIKYIFQKKKKKKNIPMDISKQQATEANPKAIQQINFSGNLNQAGNKTMLFLLKEVKELILDFSQGTVEVL